MIKSYSKLVKCETFEDRYRYLALRGVVGDPTFGFERYLNQSFYNSSEWRRMRQIVIVRDNGCDLGIEGRELNSSIYIHHMNPMKVSDLKNLRFDLLDPEFLISVSHRTHNAIHYGDERQLQKEFVERQPGDTKLW